MEKNCTFYTRNEVFAQKFDPTVKLGIKTGVWYPKMYILSLEMEKFVLFTLKIKFLPKKFTRLYKLGIKNWSLVPQNVHLVPKNGKNFTFYTKNEVFAQKLPQNVHLVQLFTLKMKFLPNWG